MKKEFYAFFSALQKNDKIKVEREVKFPKTFDSIPPELPKSLLAFYKDFELLKMEWEAKEVMYNEDAYVVGSFTINNWEVMWQDWDKIFYPEHKRGDSSLFEHWVNFKVLGYVHEGSFFGYYQDGSGKDDIFFMDDDLGFVSLSLDFNGFIEMMLASRSIAHWPRVIMYLKGDKDIEAQVEEFKTYMPQLFPDFKWEEFVAMYERVRIK